MDDDSLFTIRLVLFNFSGFFALRMRPLEGATSSNLFWAGAVLVVFMISVFLIFRNRTIHFFRTFLLVFISVFIWAYIVIPIPIEFNKHSYIISSALSSILICPIFLFLLLPPCFRNYVAKPLREKTE